MPGINYAERILNYDKIAFNVGDNTSDPGVRNNLLGDLLTTLEKEYGDDFNLQEFSEVAKIYILFGKDRISP